MKKSGFLKGVLVGIIISAIVAAGCRFGLQIADNMDDTVEIKDSDSELLNSTSESKIATIEDLIEEYYLEDVDYDSLTEGVYEGLLGGLDDPYSVYYTAEEYESLMESTSGTYCGIGVVVQQNTDTGVITVINIFDGAPSEDKILTGDIICAVDGEDIDGEDLTSVVSMIKGEKGTTVKITVYRNGEYIDYDIERSQIDVPTVVYDMLDDNIGYIQISEFEENTYDQFVEAYEELESQGMESIVFDLRDNPGGLYSVVVDMLDYILPEGTLVYTEDKNGERETEYSDADCIDIPLAVLINGNSASASEIFAGAIKDYGAGKIVGTTSFGKGIVQRIYPLSDGSAVKLTISKYYTPNGNNIHGIGIEPDIEVELDEDLTTATSIEYEDDNQLQAAIDTLE